MGAQAYNYVCPLCFTVTDPENKYIALIGQIPKAKTPNT